jgi:hypothetical protein
MTGLRIVTIAGTDTVLEERIVEEFGVKLRGELLRSGDTGYDEARRVWNGMIDKYPALVVRCMSAADVINSVNFARDNHLLLAVRGGGHNVVGTATVDGGLLIDLSSMKGIHIDPERRTARAEGGVTIGELDRNTQAFGLATPLGVVSETGIAGLTLGGGLGWLMRKYGLSCDNLVSVEVVTSDGRFLTASEEENPELFWGIRGGGGNFGVVTCFEYRLHPVGPEVMFGFVFYPGDRAKEVLRFLNEYMAQVRDEVSPVGVLGWVPHDQTFPKECHGEHYVALLAMHAGDVEEGKRVLQPLRELREPIADFSGSIPYVEAQKLLDEFYPEGGRYYWKSTNVDRLDDEAIECLIAHAETAPSQYSTIHIRYQGGAVGRIKTSETAFGDRSAPMLLSIEANWENPQDDEANVAWVQECVFDMRRFSDGGTYLNFAGFLEEGDQLIRDAYGENYERLVALKNEYDPTNLFRLNQNIKPNRVG